MIPSKTSYQSRLWGRLLHGRRPAMAAFAALFAVVGAFFPGRSFAASTLAVDKRVVKHDSTWATTITSPALSTRQTNELLVAFVTSDGPRAGNSISFSSVTGGGLTWTLRQRTNRQAGTAEIWQAVASARLTNVSVTATRAGGAYEGTMVVTAFTGADTTTNGAVATAAAANGAPTMALTTTRNGSWVWAVGYDWDNATARAVGPAQTDVDQYLATINSTFWTQRQTAPTPTSGTSVTINDTAPTSDQWNLSAIEILPATATPPPPGPTMPTNLRATPTSPTQVDLNWTGSTDNVAIAGYNIYRNGTEISTSPSTGYSDKSVSASTSYSYTVSAYDAAGKSSAQSSPANATTPAAGGSCQTPRNPWLSLEACGWPGPSNTGYVLSQCPNGQLITNSGTATRIISVTQDNTVINCQRITGGLDIQAKNVTVSNSYVEHDSGLRGGSSGGTAVIKIEDGASATIDHVETNGMDGVHACVWHQGTSEAVNAINCYGVNDGIFSWADTGYSQTTGDNFTIKNSYFHDFTTLTANGHEDGYQTEGANNGLIQHNTYLLTTIADSDVAIWDGLKSSNNIRVDNNLMTGGGFSIYAEDYNPSESTNSNPGAPVGGFTVTNISYTNNLFSTHAAPCVGQFGVWFYRGAWSPYYGGPTDGWHRSGNTVLETGENVDGGNPHVNGSLCQ